MDWFDILSELLVNGPWSYVLVVVVLILCGIGLPFPEEMTFIVAGYAVDKIHGNVWLMIGVSLIGILLGDSLTFFLGRRFGQDLLKRWPFNKLITEVNLERSRQFFRKHGARAIFIAGCMAGVRAPTFFLSATMGFSYMRFLLWDGARALVTCPISIWLGYKFGADAEELLAPYKNYLFIGIGLVAVVLLLRWLLNRRKAAVAAPVAAEALKESVTVPSSVQLESQEAAPPKD